MYDISFAYWKILLIPIALLWIALEPAQNSSGVEPSWLFLAWILEFISHVNHKEITIVGT